MRFGGAATPCQNLPRHQGAWTSRVDGNGNMIRDGTRTRPPGASAMTTRNTMKPKNVVLFITDGHRTDTLGCYGNALLETPCIDAFAAAGTRCSPNTAMPPARPARADLDDHSGHRFHREAGRRRPSVLLPLLGPRVGPPLPCPRGVCRALRPRGDGAPSARPPRVCPRSLAGTGV